MADTNPLNPLTPAHKAEIERGIEAANIGLQAIAKAKLAGIDMAQQETQLRSQLQQLTQIKSVYFPNG